MDLYAFPSFHVREPHKSSVPAVAFTLGLHNKGDKPLDVSFMFNLPLGQQEDTIRVGDNFGEVVFTRWVETKEIPPFVKADWGIWNYLYCLPRWQGRLEWQIVWSQVNREQNKVDIN